MKTRRILAASTAALLAFGSVAVVASAGAVTTTLTITGSGSDGTVTVNAGGNAVTSGNTFTTADDATTTITITTAPSSGKEVDTVKVNGNSATGSGNSYSYDVPANTSTVTVAVTWKAETIVTPPGGAITASDVTGKTEAQASGSNVKGAISFNAGTGSSYVITALKADGKDLTGGTDANYTNTAVAAAITDANLKSASVGGVTVSMAKKDALKLSGRYEVKVEAKDVNEASDSENVSFDEDEAIADLGLSKENIAILKKTKADKVKLFNITVAKGGEVANSIGKSLKVEVGSSFAGAKVYHVNDDGSLTLLDSKTPNMLDGTKTTTFTTSKFSPFIVTTAELKATKASTDDTSSAATSSGTASTNPNTGIALAIAPVVLAAGAVAVVALKKKH